jgi:hypothetical protein
MADIAAIVQGLLPILSSVMGGALGSSDAGFLGKLREGAAAGDFIHDAAQEFAGNSIISGLIEMVTDGGKLRELLPDGPSDMAATLEQVGGLDALLGDAGEEGTQVKQFVYGFAERIANASGSGFFGGGDKVSEGEAQFLNELKAKLGL